MFVKIITLLVYLNFTGCSIASFVLYKIDVQQGNIVTQEMLEKLKPGMTRSQVRFVMGTPLVVDAFRNNRWDYVYLFQKKGEFTDKQGLVIFFEDDRLTYIENNTNAMTLPIEFEKTLSTPAVPEKKTIKILHPDDN